jgi:hypothetical protein
MPRSSLRLLVAATVALAAFSTPVVAETNDDMSFSGMFKLDRLDRNKDRMVSRAEFLEQMGRMWDMKMKEMKVKRDLLTEQELQQVLMYMRAGG